MTELRAVDKVRGVIAFRNLLILVTDCDRFFGASGVLSAQKVWAKTAAFEMTWVRQRISCFLKLPVYKRPLSAFFMCSVVAMINVSATGLSRVMVTILALVQQRMSSSDAIIGSNSEIDLALSGSISSVRG